MVTVEEVADVSSRKKVIVPGIMIEADVSAVMEKSCTGFARGMSELPPDVAKSLAQSCFTLRDVNRFAAGAVLRGRPGRLSVYRASPKFARSAGNPCPVACSMATMPL